MSDNSTSNAPMISVVIPTLNREAPLRTVLTYFLEVEQYPRFEIIVVDQSDKHDAETISFLQKYDLQLIYVRVNYKSLPKARNDGVNLAKGEIVLFVDDDCVPSHGFLAAHAIEYRDQKIIGVAGPTPLPGQQLLSREAIGEERFKSLIETKAMRFDVDFSFDAQWAQGANCSFRRAMIVTIGGFDEGFPGVATGEDAEFSNRARKIGLIRYAPSAYLVHEHVSTGGCRDVNSRRAYVKCAAFCANYFWFRVGCTPWTRFREIWRKFRAEVFGKNEYTLQAAIGFFEGLVASSVYIYGITRKQRREGRALSL
jgi:GT2 family glycosyltransferase